MRISSLTKNVACYCELLVAFANSLVLRLWCCILLFAAVIVRRWSCRCVSDAARSCLLLSLLTRGFVAGVMMLHVTVLRVTLLGRCPFQLHAPTAKLECSVSAII